MPNADLAFGVLTTELWSSAGAALGAQGIPAARSPRARPSSRARLSSAAATGSPRRSRPSAVHGLLAPWVLHTGLGPDARCLGVHDPGDRGRDRARRHACAEGAVGSKLVERSLGHRARRQAGRSRRAQTSSRSWSRTGARPASAWRTDRLVRASKAVVANVTPTTALRPPARGPPCLLRRSRRRGGSATAAARCRSTSRSTSRRAGRATSGSGARRSST